jgi:N-acyl-D-amino-acid deacylase
MPLNENGPRLRISFFASLAVATAVSLFAYAGVGVQKEQRPEAYDFVIENGRIVDGTGNPWFYGDVAVLGARIARIVPRGGLQGAPAREHINAEGLVVAPGFIDILSSSDHPFLLGDGRSVGKVTQGITTEILGEGWTDAPISDRTLEAADQMGIGDAGTQRALRQFMGPEGFGRWLDGMQQHGISPNVGSFLGAITLRAYAKGMAAGPSTPSETETMRAVMRNAMEEGAFGLGSALIYPPGSYASSDELIQISKAMASYGGIYSTHIRSEGDQLLESMDEAIRIGREAGVPVEIYHLKAAGRRNWSKEAPAVARINAARAAGQDVQANMYPYEAGGTALWACLPPWASANGKLLDNLSDAEKRTKIRNDVLAESRDWENVCQLATPSGVVVLGFHLPEDQKYSGKSLSQIAADRQQEWVDALMELLLRERGRLSAMFFLASEENIRLQLREPWIKFGTDAEGEDPQTAVGLTHPRSYGTFPRILGRYVREERILPLEEAIRKMSSAVAERLSISDRGLLKQNFFADVVVFNPNTIMDRATYEKPQQLSEGVRFVLVNGQMVVREGVHTGAKPGRVVRGPGFKGLSR